MSTFRIPSASGTNAGTLNAAKGALAGAGAGAAASSSSNNKAAPKTYPFWLGGELQFRSARTIATHRVAARALYV